MLIRLVDKFKVGSSRCDDRTVQRAGNARWLTGKYSGGMWLPQNKTMKISVLSTNRISRK
jgi:hypothetical protein